MAVFGASLDGNTAPMPRALWSGSISFGLVNVPVRMLPAIAEHKLQFHYVHAPDSSRIGYEKICKEEGKPVPDGAALLLADLLVADPARVGRVHIVELELVLGDRGEHPDRHVHESERDAPRPEGPRHGRCIPAWRGRENRRPS